MILNFPEIEEKILKFWAENKIFEKSLNKPSPKGEFVFFDGPPFATGTPHYGHIVASLMKDVVPRFWTMQGYHVSRRWGWDCHGLPIENLVESELGISSKKDIEADVCGFNEACRASVLRYADVWKKFIPRIGRWVDMENDYRTMDSSYMESIWWVFKTLYNKKLIYEGYKSMHICPRCQTTLSNFEVAQNYKEIKDLSVVAKFELVDEPKTYVLAWTTTPWTLPANVALAINRGVNYVKMFVKNFPEISDGIYIFSKKDYENYREVIEAENKKSDKVRAEIIEEFKGEKLVGRKYKPLFDYYADKQLENAYTIQAADFVSDEDGTGIVHIAPSFGEDDLNLAKKQNLPIISNVNTEGKFKPEVKDFAGEEVKPKEDPQKTDKKIVEYLKNKGLVFKEEEFLHSYPICYRCDTPLLNFAANSWFVKVTKIKSKIIKNNKKINWFPEHIKEGRFGKWLEGAEDWAISRQRYWGTPLPVWKCDCGEVVVIGSIEELEKISGKKVNDLHKHIVDEIIFECKKCKGKMKRIPDVLDCWFESGSMPYAQIHYPFENKKWFEKNFPAQFIAEGVDQTRGWFYALLVLSTALFDKPAFENVIANGIVLAEDGKKMSKRLKNYPEPDSIIEKYSADALRYYFLTSPVMEAENLNFSENGVKESLQKTAMLFSNVLNFYLLLNPEKIEKPKPKNILDKWIVSRLNNVNQEITGQMEKYNLIKASRPIADFIDEFSTWYLRRSRERFKNGDKDGINTFGFVLLEFSKITAPFLPFLAEDAYKKIGGEKESVHLEDWPKTDKKLIDENLEEKMKEAKNMVATALSERNVKIRQPLNSVTFKKESLKNENEIIDLIKEELNVKKVEFDKNIEKEVVFDTNITEELKNEGTKREGGRTIRGERKELGLTPLMVVKNITSTASIFKDLVDEDLLKEWGAKEFKVVEKESDMNVDIKKEIKIDGKSYYIGIKK